MKKTLIVYGGWEGHEPVEVANRFKKMLLNEGFDVEMSDSLDSFLDIDKLYDLDLIVPVWTMGKITKEQEENVIKAVASGVGIAGCHGGMCDSFRESTKWQFMTGGQWVAHPGSDKTKHTVNIKNSSSEIINGIKDFDISSEQYYLHVDPAVEVLATTRFPTANGYHILNKAFDMPYAWTKMWGYGRVFYTALGHHDDIFDIPEVTKLMIRGMLWAAKGKAIAIKNGGSIKDFEEEV